MASVLDVVCVVVMSTASNGCIVGESFCVCGNSAILSYPVDGFDEGALVEICGFCAVKTVETLTEACNGCEMGVVREAGCCGEEAPMVVVTACRGCGAGATVTSDTVRIGDEEFSGGDATGGGGGVKRGFVGVALLALSGSGSFGGKVVAWTKETGLFGLALTGGGDSLLRRLGASVVGFGGGGDSINGGGRSNSKSNFSSVGDLLTFPALSASSISCSSCSTPPSVMSSSSSLCFCSEVAAISISTIS